VQIGDGNVQHNTFVSRPAAPTWPIRAGTVPPPADGFQPRMPGGPPYPLWDRDTPCHVLTGTGGVGKTQLAAALARRAWAAGDVDLLVWVEASTRAAIVTGYGRAGIAVAAGPERPADSAALLLDWLAGTDRRWLVVLDDLNDPGDLRGLWPPATETGRTLVTTRRRDAALTGPGRRVWPVGPFSAGEAAGYLRAKLGAQADAAEALAQDLGLLPLALAQAVAYLADRGLTPGEYRVRLRDARRRLADLVPEAGALPDDYPVALSAVWDLSVAHADALRPRGLARPMLELISLLDPNGIPGDVLTAAPVRAVTGVADPDDLRDALYALHRLNLITVDRADPARLVRVHALIQRVARERLPDQRRARLVHAAAAALAGHWPDVPRDADLAQVLRANAAALAAQAGDDLLTGGVDPVLWHAGDSLGQVGQAADAARYWRSLSERAARVLGPGHRDAFTARYKAAYWSGQAGDATAAIAGLAALLDDQMPHLGAEHPDTLRVQRDLADWRGTAGDPGRAAADLARLLPHQSRLLGPDHPDVLHLRHNLGRWRGNAGDPRAAVEEFRAVLAARLRLLGPDHLDTLSARGNLALWQGEAGDATAAAAGFATLLHDQVRLLGPRHPHTLQTRGHLAHWRQAAGEPSPASDLDDLIADQQRVLGSGHPDPLRTRRLRALRIARDGDPDGAAELLAALLAEQVRLLGEDHLETRATRQDLERLRAR